MVPDRADTAPPDAPRLAEPTGEPLSGDLLAAVDLGSNSFHMIVARVSHGQLVVVDRMREMVRLAAGLDDHHQLDAASRRRALQCLQRFGQRLREVRAERVRVVGTNTLRRARRSRAFREACEQALGHPVEIISGREEARLVYLGVAHTSPAPDGVQLVVDIGGGSTELIVGEGFTPRTLESLSMGCVGMTRRFFDDGRLSARRFERARLAARLELRPVRAYFVDGEWSRVMGSSGTIRAVASVASELGLTGEAGTITADAAEALVAHLTAAGRAEKLDLPGLSVERAPVFAGGLCVLIEVLRELRIERMRAADGALREGLLFDMLGRLQHEDARELTVRAMMSRFHADPGQAARVEATALRFYHQLEQSLGLVAERDRALLCWAARLHEVGLDISHSKYHRHGGYLLEHADLPGFPRAEQRMLAMLVGFHRRKLDALDLDRLPESWRRNALAMLVVLRLAVLLHRDRASAALPVIRMSYSPDELGLHVDGDWLESNPLTLADLREEVRYLRRAGIQLNLAGAPDPV